MIVVAVLLIFDPANDNVDVPGFVYLTMIVAAIAWNIILNMATSN